MPYADRPAFSCLTLGGMLGWADADKDGVVNVKETQYSQQALGATLVGRTQEPQIFGDNDALVWDRVLQMGPILLRFSASQGWCQASKKLWPKEKTVHR